MIVLCYVLLRFMVDRMGKCLALSVSVGFMVDTEGSQIIFKCARWYVVVPMVAACGRVSMSSVRQYINLCIHFLSHASVRKSDTQLNVMDSFFYCPKTDLF